MEDSVKTTAMPLVVCLGNPGEEYAETRHNCGFKVGERLLSGLAHESCGWQPGNGVLDVVRRPDHGPFLVVRPLTYMNLSGECVVRVTGHFGISPSEVLVISDDVDLPFGRLRLRPGGKSGGQKGLGSIIAGLGTEAVPRLRVGIGRPQSSSCDLCEHVLSRWTSVEQAVLPSVLDFASSMVLLSLDEGLEAAMRQCNVWSTDNNNADK